MLNLINKRENDGPNCEQQAIKHSITTLLIKAVSFSSASCTPQHTHPVVWSVLCRLCTHGDTPFVTSVGLLKPLSDPETQVGWKQCKIQNQNHCKRAKNIPNGGKYVQFVTYKWSIVVYFHMRIEEDRVVQVYHELKLLCYFASNWIKLHNVSLFSIF